MKLISDFPAWILSYSNLTERHAICDFIIKNFNQIRHVKNVHAKVLITNDSAFLGSSNFTYSGVLEKIEMSISISENNIVGELKDWYQALWENSMSFTKEELYNFVTINQNTNTHPPINGLNIFNKNGRQKSALTSLNNKDESQKDYETKLITAIQKNYKDRVWLNKYFDLIKKLFIEFDIDENSEKITLPVNQNNTMPISIGQRYIVNATKYTIGFILPFEFENTISEFEDLIIEEGPPFTTNNQEDALWFSFDHKIIFSDQQLLFDYWKIAIEKELERTKISKSRKFNNPYYYKAVMDLDYRKKVFDLAYN